MHLSLAVAGGIALARLAGSGLVSAVLPFLAAYAASRLVRPLGLKLCAACRVNEKAGCAVFAVLVCGAACYFAVFASGRIFSAVQGLLGSLPMITDAFNEALLLIYERFPWLSDSGVLPFVGDLLGEAVTYVGSAVAEAVGGAVSSLGGGVVSAVFGGVAFVYLVSDMDGALAGVKRLIPEKYAQRLCSALRGAESACFAYFRSCLILGGITLVLVFVGLWILGVSSPFALSLMITLIDALPMLGCGVVLVPWAAWCFIRGSVGRGVWLSVLFIVTYLVRQFFEPRIIGRMTGAHPFVALVAVCLGWRLGGVIGVVLAPAVLILISEARYGGMSSTRAP